MYLSNEINRIKKIPSLEFTKQTIDFQILSGQPSQICVVFLQKTTSAINLHGSHII